LHTTSKARQGRSYTVKNRNEQERTVLVEHPVNPLFKLVETPAPAETARDVYRFELKVPAGQTKVLTVTEERQFGETIAISNQNDDQVRWFLAQPITSERLKEGLKQALALRGAVGKTQREIAEQQRQLRVITEDQVRLRANLKEMPPTAKAYKRYLDKFDAQETQIEAYQAQIKKLQATEHNQKKELEDFLAHLSAD
jgi:hypothetical protein